MNVYMYYVCIELQFWLTLTVARVECVGEWQVYMFIECDIIVYNNNKEECLPCIHDVVVEWNRTKPEVLCVFSRE